MLTERPATMDDYDFLYALHKAAMKESIKQIWGWDETWQQKYFQEKFDSAKRQILQWQGKDVGTISIEERDDGIYLALIELLPEYQERGWGTAVLKEIIRQAKQQHKLLSLHVLKTNHRTKALYKRLGFSIIAVEEHKYKMQLTSQPAPD